MHTMSFSTSSHDPAQLPTPPATVVTNHKPFAATISFRGSSKGKEWRQAKKEIKVDGEELTLFYILQSSSTKRQIYISCSFIFNLKTVGRSFLVGIWLSSSCSCSPQPTPSTVPVSTASRLAPTVVLIFTMLFSIQKSATLLQKAMKGPYNKVCCLLAILSASSFPFRVNGKLIAVPGWITAASRCF